MSLTVNAYTYEKGLLKIVWANVGNELFGPEECRHRLWGHPVMSLLGLVILPSLSHANIFAEGEKMQVLEKELLAIMDGLSEVAKATDCSKEFVAMRCQNALRAIKTARELGGGVTIG